jgi:hypothetical protein
MEKQKGEKGSILVLTLISVLILSLIVTGLLSVGTTEIHSTQNFHLSRAAYYKALEGVEEIRNMIYDKVWESEISTISRSPANTLNTESFDGGDEGRRFKNLGIKRSYITGNLKDFKDNTPQLITQYPGLNAPPPPGLLVGLGEIARFSPKLYKVQITAEVAMGKRTGYSEIIAGIYALEPQSQEDDE